MTPIETPQGDRNEGYSHVTRLIKPLVLTFWFPMLGGWLHWLASWLVLPGGTKKATRSLVGPDPVAWGLKSQATGS